MKHTIVGNDQCFRIPPKAYGMENPEKQPQLLKQCLLSHRFQILFQPACLGISHLWADETLTWPVETRGCFRKPVNTLNYLPLDGEAAYSCSPRLIGKPLKNPHIQHHTEPCNNNY